MKYLLVFSLMIILFPSYGQFAIIKDKDGYVNVRSSGTGDKIIDTLATGRYVYCSDVEGDWCNVVYLRKEESHSGKIHKSRVNLLSGYAPVKKIKNGQAFVVFQSGTIKVTVSDTTFDRRGHKLTYSKNDNGDTTFNKVDGGVIWGSDGSLPLKQYKKITIETGDKLINLPAASLKNLFEPNLEDTKVYYDKLTDCLYIEALNSENSGGYVLLFIIEKGKYKERIVTYGF